MSEQSRLGARSQTAQRKGESDIILKFVSVKVHFQSLLNSKWFERVVIPFATVAVFYVIEHFGVRLYQYLSGRGQVLTKVGFIFLVSALGYLAFKFKESNQRWYGTVEIAVGMASAIRTIWSIEIRTGNFDTATALALVGSVYVVARGFNNYSEAKSKAKSKDRIPAVEEAISNIPYFIQFYDELKGMLTRNEQIKRKLLSPEKLFDGRILQEYLEALTSFARKYDLRIDFEAAQFLGYFSDVYNEVRVHKRLLQPDRQVEGIFDALHLALMESVSVQSAKAFPIQQSSLWGKEN